MVRPTLTRGAIRAILATAVGLVFGQQPVPKLAARTRDYGSSEEFQRVPSGPKGMAKLIFAAPT